MLAAMRRSDAGREVDLVVTEVELAALAEVLRSRLQLVEFLEDREPLYRLLVVMDERLREVLSNGA